MTKLKNSIKNVHPCQVNCVMFAQNITNVNELMQHSCNITTQEVAKAMHISIIPARKFVLEQLHYQKVCFVDSSVFNI